MKGGASRIGSHISSRPAISEERKTMTELLHEYEIKLITEAIEANNGNIVKAAVFLGECGSTIHHRMRRRGIVHTSTPPYWRRKAGAGP